MTGMRKHVMFNIKTTLIGKCLGLSLLTLLMSPGAYADAVTTMPPLTSSVQPHQPTTIQSQQPMPPAAPAVSAPAATKIQVPNKLTNPPAEETHLWNLTDADILAVIAEVSRETDKIFIVDPSVTGKKITIVSGKPLTRTEIYPVFLAALQVLGYGTVQKEAFVKIVPNAEAVQNNSAADNLQAKLPGSDEFVVKVLSLHYVPASPLAQSLSPFIPGWAKVTPYTPSNSLILSGTRAIVNNVLDIIAKVDTPAANGIDVIRLQHADATETAKTVETVLQANRSTLTDASSAISVDVRTNSILISGNASTRLHYKVLIAQLDGITQSNNSDTQTFNLQYASVQSILPIMRVMARQSVNSYSNQQSNNYNFFNRPSTGGADSDGSADAPALPEISNDTLNSGASSNDKSGITIAGDVPHNILIITAPPNVMRAMRGIIRQLDVRPKQILIEAIIAQLDAKTALDLGITGGKFELKVPAFNFGHHLGDQNPFTPFSVSDMTLLLHALNMHDNSSILSTPSTLVLNNEVAQFRVGQSRPINSSTITDPSSKDSKQTTQVSYKNIGLVLNIAPQIAGTNSVLLRVSQSNSSLVTTSGDTAGSNPITNTEMLKSSILTNNSEIIVLGGLQSSQETMMVTRVPVLSSIPILGLLFQSKHKMVEKKNLVIFLRPTIIDNDEEATRISQAKYDYMRQLQLNGVANNNNFLAGTSVLPAHQQPEFPVPFGKFPVPYGGKLGLTT